MNAKSNKKKNSYGKNPTEILNLGKLVPKCYHSGFGVIIETYIYEDNIRVIIIDNAIHPSGVKNSIKSLSYVELFLPKKPKNKTLKVINIGDIIRFHNFNFKYDSAKQSFLGKPSHYRYKSGWQLFYFIGDRDPYAKSNPAIQKYEFTNMRLYALREWLMNFFTILSLKTLLWTPINNKNSHPYNIIAKVLSNEKIDKTYNLKLQIDKLKEYQLSISEDLISEFSVGSIVKIGFIKAIEEPYVILDNQCRYVIQIPEQFYDSKMFGKPETECIIEPIIIIDSRSKKSGPSTIIIDDDDDEKIQKEEVEYNNQNEMLQIQNSNSLSNSNVNNPNYMIYPVFYNVNDNSFIPIPNYLNQDQFNISPESVNNKKTLSTQVLSTKSESKMVSLSTLEAVKRKFEASNQLMANNTSDLNSCIPNNSSSGTIPSINNIKSGEEIRAMDKITNQFGQEYSTLVPSWTQTTFENWKQNLQITKKLKLVPTQINEYQINSISQSNITKVNFLDLMVNDKGTELFKDKIYKLRIKIFHITPDIFKKCLLLKCKKCNASRSIMNWNDIHCCHHSMIAEYNFNIIFIDPLDESICFKGSIQNSNLPSYQLFPGIDLTQITQKNFSDYSDLFEIGIQELLTPNRIYDMLFTILNQSKEILHNQKYNIKIIDLEYIKKEEISD